MNYLAGGANSPIPIPTHYPNDIVSGHGPYVVNKNGDKYVDLWMGYGALLFGHADPLIVKTIQESVPNGWFFSYQTALEKELAEIIHDTIPSAERVRFATSGSDAVAYGIRVSRAYTGRAKVLSIIGGYHGVHENMIPSEGTVPSPVDRVPFNDIEAAKKELSTKQYACFVLEPILANAGCTPPEAGYLQAIRELCTETDTVLIFDEVVMGFRASVSGAQGLFGITPDLSLFSKAIAGGLPLSVICGKKEIMEHFMPGGNVFFAGTFNANPLSLSVAKVVINRLKEGDTYHKTEVMGNKLRSFIQEQINSLELPASVQGIGSMLTIAFGCKSFKRGIVLEAFDPKLYSSFIEKMAKRHILLPPLPTETIFLSPVHEEVIGDIMSAIKGSLEEMQKEL